MSQFKKLAVATAVSAAMGGIGSAQAVDLGEPGNALLVPYAKYDSSNSINTLVGITLVNDNAVDVSDFATTDDATSTACGTTSETIHWYFFNTSSVHQLDNTFKMTCDDFEPFDWGKMVQNSGKSSLDGATGYLVFADTTASDGSTAADTVLYGEAALVEGNWASAGFIPVIPLADDNTNTISATNEINYSGAIPSEVSPINAGMVLAGNSGSTRMDMRYFLDPALNGGTDLVVWLHNNYDNSPSGETNYSSVGVDVYDTEETKGSDTIDLSDELNVIDASTLAWTDHTDADGTEDSGFVRINLASTGDTNAAGVAFSLLRFGTSGNANQVQTALAHERGVN